MGCRLRCYCPASPGTTISSLNTVQGRIDSNENRDAQTAEGVKDDEAAVNGVEFIDEVEVSPICTQNCSLPLSSCISVSRMGRDQRTNKIHTITSWKQWLPAEHFRKDAANAPDVDRASVFLEC